MSKRHVVDNGKRNGKKKEGYVVVSARTPGQKRYIIEIQNNDVTICTGPAGTGKTAIAVGLGLQYITAESTPYDRLVIMRPVKEACDEHIGYLPGDLEEKMIPWAAPVVDNMALFMDSSKVKLLFHAKKIEVIPLAYARGRSLNRSFIIVDEAQNCSDKQMLMVLTRIGEGSKMVINGDLDQSDTMHIVNGLADAATRLHGVEGIGVVSLESRDIVRNPMIREIIRRYKASIQDDEIDPVTAHSVLEAMAVS